MSNIYILGNKNISGIISMPIINISNIPYSLDISLYDVVLFTSRNSVMALKSEHTFLKSMIIYSLGLETQKKLSEFGIKSEVLGIDQKGDDFAISLVNKLKDKRVIFPRAKRIESNIVNILRENSINIDELIVYTTTCTQDSFSTPLKNSVIIFSSPSTVKCFLDSFNWDNSYKAIAIGEVTASFVPQEIPVLISEHHSLESCVKLAKTI